jgi:hypothetical protein
LTKALIARAYLEVDLHMDRVRKALSTFLLEDFSPAYLGLAQGARNHLNRFQRFLHNFYTDKHGYWPPLSYASPFPKALYKSIFYDFKSLYDLLVDTQSYTDFASQKPASGGICVLQIVDQFNTRHKFTAQVHPLPLLPNDIKSQKPTKSLSSTSRNNKPRDPNAVLLAATNGLNAKAYDTKIIQEYIQFERTYATGVTRREDKISMADARKINWLLIYGTLQYLTSALRAPSAVRDTESPEYPLCCLIAGQTSWNARTSMAVVSSISPATVSGTMIDYFDGAQHALIQPDCLRDDYFAPETQARCSPCETVTPFKITLPLRQPSMRSLASLTSPSPLSSRRNSLTLKPIAHCIVNVQGYSGGVVHPESSAQISPEQGNATKSSCPPELGVSQQHNEEASSSEPQAVNAPARRAAMNVLGLGHSRKRTPLLNTLLLDQMVANTNSAAAEDAMSRSDSTGSTNSSVWSNSDSAASSKSTCTSTDGERQPTYKTSKSEHSGLLGGLVSIDGTRVSLEMSENGSFTSSHPQANVHPLLREQTPQQGEFCFDFDDTAREAAKQAMYTGPIGLAVSALPPHAASSSQNPSSLSATSPTLKKSTCVTAVPVVDSASEINPNPRRRGRGLDIFAGLVAAPGELRDRYNLAMKRSGSLNLKTNQQGEPCYGIQSNALPPTVTKTSHASKGSSLRERIRHDDVRKERRMSSFWQ